MNCDFLQKYRGKRVAIAVSGGADSMCLLYIFHENADAYQITLSAITCQHQIRGEAAERDLEFVKAFCLERNIPLAVFSADVPARAKASGRGLEEEGRIFRYECFQKILDEGQADLVATAHHKGDVAETVLFRLARGTSLAGIDAIQEKSGIVRPILSVTKAEILTYLKERNIAYVVDETNDDERYSRNAIRKSVLPALEKIVHGATEHIADFARRAGEDNAYLNSLAEGAVWQGWDGIYIPVDLPRPLLIRAVALAVRKLGGRDYGEKALQEVEKLLGLQSGRKVRFCGIEAIKERNDLVLYQIRERFLKELPLSQGTFEVGRYRAIIGEERVPGALYTDYDKFPTGCVLRTRREGDLFTPFGGRQKTLKKYLTDKKIPARIGAELPLIAQGNTVYAIFGVEISDAVKVTGETKRLVYLSRERIE